MQIKLIFTTKVWNLASFRNWEFLELESGLFVKPRFNISLQEKVKKNDNNNLN